MVLLLIITLFLTTPLFADDPLPGSADKLSEVQALFQIMGHAYDTEKNSILNIGKPKPPTNPYFANNPNHVPYPYAKDKPLDIDGEILGLCMALVTKAPFEYTKDKATCTPINLGSGKTKDKNPQTSILNYLAGYKRSCDWTSGHETELHDWVLAQPDNSIDPVAIYKKSIELNSGNLWTSILTIYQLLRNNDHWVLGDYYDYDSSADKQRLFFNKFIDIRGDLEQRGKDFHGDHFGSWYRIWGAMLYRLNLLDEKDFVAGLPPVHACLWTTVESLPGSGSRAIHGLIKDWHSSAIFWGEEFVKLHVREPAEEDSGKYFVDQAGGEAASSLIGGLWDPSKPGKSSLTAEKCLKDRPYLVDTDTDIDPGYSF